MDSFLLAETFKYLYLLFSEKDDLLFDPDDWLFTTEAHLLPLNMALNGHQGESVSLTNSMRQVCCHHIPMHFPGRCSRNIGAIKKVARIAEASCYARTCVIAQKCHTPRDIILITFAEHRSAFDEVSCPNPRAQFNGELRMYARHLRRALHNYVDDAIASRGGASVCGVHCLLLTLAKYVQRLKSSSRSKPSNPKNSSSKAAMPSKWTFDCTPVASACAAYPPRACILRLA